MSIEAQLMAAGAKNQVVEPAAIDFDGTNDYLSRSTNLVGNVDGKTFTLSAWVYPTTINDSNVNNFFSALEPDTGADVTLQLSATSGVRLFADNISGTRILFAETVNPLPKNTWSHVLVSIDISSTGTRAIYVNNASVSVTWDTYVNEALAFNGSQFHVGYKYTGRAVRFSNIYLDYTYRDLSIESNRRLFITADGKPAKDQASLNPILYLPLDDYEAPGLNLGTGGDFTLNSVVAQSGRGPNQWNCVASKFDGSADYLSRSTPSDISDGNTFSAHFKYKAYTSSSDRIIIGHDNFKIHFLEGKLGIEGRERDLFGGDTYLDAISVDTVSIEGRYLSVDISIDLSSVSKRHVYVNNTEIPMNWITYTNGTIDFTRDYGVGANPSAGDMINGVLGELYFDTAYIDLATNNPFWDEDAGKLKPVLQVVEETGYTPPIAMPIRADDAGKNYGTGGDFTVNSGPYIGARGASEFLARSVVVDTTNYLSHPGITCESLVKWKSTDSGATWTVSYLNNVTVTNIGDGTDNGVVAYYFGTSEVIDWNQEANRLRFTDAFGYPTSPEINANTLLYLPFDDSANFGKNLGTGGDFTVNGTVTPGADVDPN